MRLLVVVVVLGLVGCGSSFKLFDGKSLKCDGDSNCGDGKIWALITAGSNDWINYRHQADVSHAFHVLKNHGVLEDNIITMMYDDIANNSANPFPGKIFNGPTAENGTNVYEGVKIDYRGDDVNPDNFLAILQGQKDKVKGGNGRVLESTKNDRVFVYFSDHGGVGTICFPDGHLTVKNLNDALKNMHTQGLYKELVFYLETCHSASMFNNTLPNDINIYAITAANTTHSSYPTYCHLDSKLDTCLGDEFSVSWMEDSDIENLHNETLERQFEIVKNKTVSSTVHRFGDLKISKEPVSNFQGEKEGPTIEKIDNEQKYERWPSRDVPFKMLEAKLGRTNDADEKSFILKQLTEMTEKREYLHKHMESLVQKLVSDKEIQRKMMTEIPEAITKLDCHNDIVHAYGRICFNLGKNPYALGYTNVLTNLCEYGMEPEKIIQTMEGHCKNVKYNDIL